MPRSEPSGHLRCRPRREWLDYPGRISIHEVKHVRDGSHQRARTRRGSRLRARSTSCSVSHESKPKSSVFAHQFSMRCALHERAVRRSVSQKQGWRERSKQGWRVNLAHFRLASRRQRLFPSEKRSKRCCLQLRAAEEDMLTGGEEMMVRDRSPANRFSLATVASGRPHTKEHLKFVEPSAHHRDQGRNR